MKRHAKRVKASKKSAPINTNSPEKKSRVARSLTLPWKRVPIVAPIMAPGAAQTMRFQGITEKPRLRAKGRRA